MGAVALQRVGVVQQQQQLQQLMTRRLDDRRTNDWSPGRPSLADQCINSLHRVHVSQLRPGRYRSLPAPPARHGQFKTRD